MLLVAGGLPTSIYSGKPDKRSVRALRCLKICMYASIPLLSLTACIWGGVYLKSHAYWYGTYAAQ